MRCGCCQAVGAIHMSVEVFHPLMDGALHLCAECAPAMESALADYGILPRLRVVADEEERRTA